MSDDEPVKVGAVELVKRNVQILKKRLRNIPDCQDPDAWSLLVVIIFLEAIGFRRNELIRLDRIAFGLMDQGLRDERRSAGRSGALRPTIETWALATISAIVTTMKADGIASVREAIEIVARETGFSPKRISSYRNNLNRGLGSEFDLICYGNKIEELSISKKEGRHKVMREMLSDVREFVKTIPKCNMS